MDKLLVLKKIDIDNVLPFYNVLSECGRFMYEKLGLEHWYPFMDIQTFQTLMCPKDIYGIYCDGEAVATFNLSLEARDYYTNELWSNPDEKAVYLGQLGIKPNLQGNGIGKWCMQQVEKITLAMGGKAIRFDAVNMHPWLSSFYKNLGYMPRGLVKPKQWDLLCFEKTF